MRHYKKIKIFTEFHFPWITAGFIRTKESLLMVGRHLTPCLDVGCGDGSFAKLTLSEKIEVGCDLVVNNKSLWAYRKVLACDIRKAPFKNQTFNTVLANSTLEHIDGIEDALKQISRILKINGYLIFTVPCSVFNDYFYSNYLTKIFKHVKFLDRKKQYHRKFFHKNILSLDDWKKLLNRHHLKVEKAKYYISTKLVFIHSLLADILTAPLPVGKYRRVYGCVFFLRDRFRNKYMKFIISNLFICSLGRYYLRDIPSDKKGGYLFMKARKINNI